MAKRTQRFGLLIAWWVCGASCFSTFAQSLDLPPQNDFFGKNQGDTLHIGIESWANYTKRVIKQHWAIGSEVSIGPIVEWHPFNGIAFQTGLFYSYNSFYTIDFVVDRKALLEPSFFAFSDRFINTMNDLSSKSEGYTARLAFGTIQFHAISIPLFFRFYPEKSRRLVCYGGPRLIWMLPFSEKKQYCPISIDTASIKNILYDALIDGKNIANDRDLTVQDMQNIAQQGLSKVYCSMFKLDPGRAPSQLFTNKLFNWDLVWDFGLEFKGKSGYIVGINGLGIVLGYNFIQSRSQAVSLEKP